MMPSESSEASGLDDRCAVPSTMNQTRCHSTEGDKRWIRVSSRWLSHSIQPNPGRYAYSGATHKRVEPTWKTPVDEVEARGTQGHP
jgi:hypothetical protein